jgi:twitching motility protein PilT
MQGFFTTPPPVAFEAPPQAAAPVAFEPAPVACEPAPPIEYQAAPPVEAEPAAAVPVAEPEATATPDLAPEVAPAVEPEAFLPQVDRLYAADPAFLHEAQYGTTASHEADMYGDFIPPAEPAGHTQGDLEVDAAIAEVVAEAEALVVGVAESEAGESAYARLTTEERVQSDDVILDELLALVLEKNASDLHLTTGARPSIRLHGDLRQLDEYPVLTPPVIQRVMYSAITQRQREKFEEELELDFAYSLPGKARFRVNIYRQRDALGAAFRLIPFEIKKLEELGMPPSVNNLAQLPRGFVLVTGPTGSGKSTTLASLLDLANRTRNDHIMTVEDPIEFLHRHRSCLVNQREVGEDTKSFGNALKHVLRQDPDIILVGEMRDLETISVALTAAETGHLVFATLHTQDAAQTIDRVIDVFPSHQQEQIRVQLASSLQGVVCQTLCKTADGRGRVVAAEVLYATPAIRNLIREGKTHQIYSAMQAGAQHGMQTMDQHLADLVKAGRITYEHGLEKCHHVEDFNRLLAK